MAIIGNTYKTLADVAKETDPDGNTADIAETLHETNEWLDDIPWMEGNLMTGDRTTVRSSLPTVYFRQLNEMVEVSKSTSQTIDNAAAMIEAWSEVDKKVLNMQADPAKARALEDAAFVESMGQKLSDTLAYGNAATDPASFNGFATRYATGVTGTAYLDSMINGGGSGSDNMSMYLVGWSPKTVTGIYPKGSKAGLDSIDHGLTTKTVGTTKMAIYETQFTWDVGLAVKQWQYVVRVCNIDWSALTTESSNADLIKLMIRAEERLPNTTYSDTYRPVWYVPKAVKTMLRIQQLNHSNNNLTTETLAGKKVTVFGGIPVRQVDSLTKSEAAVSFV